MVRKIVRALGFDVVRYPYKPRKVQILNKWKGNIVKLMNSRGVDLVLDVGSNIGQYGKDIRKLGYAGKIVSFEPLKEPFNALRKASENDDKWEIFNYALGDVSGTSSINVAANSMSSSILPMRELHEQSAPESKYIASEEIQIRRLDDLMDKFSTHKQIYLKLDVQGYEQNVLNGLRRNLKNITGIQTEMSLVELYDGELTFFEYSKKLLDEGFTLMSVEPGFFDPETGRLLQVDGIWYRKI